MLRPQTVAHPVLLAAKEAGATDTQLHMIGHVIESEAEAGKPIESNEDLYKAYGEYYAH